MIQHLLLSSFRFIKRNKLFAFINILGMSSALAISFIIVLFVINEYSYDSNYQNRDNIYRVLEYNENFDYISASSAYILANHLNEEFPQVKKVARTRYIRSLRLKINNEWVDVSRSVGTEPALFDMFSLATSGSGKELLKDKNQLVLSESEAMRLFGEENPVGKVVKAIVNNDETTLTVSGTFDDFPYNSSFKADCFLHSDWTLPEVNKGYGIDNAHEIWEFNYWTTWVLLNDQANPVDLAPSFRALEAKVKSEYFDSEYSLQSMSDMYLGSQNISNNLREGNLFHIRVFTAIGLLIIVVAAFNYIILSTAISTHRSKEIGVRKTVGAARQTICFQLLFESVTLSLLIMPLALAIAFAVKPCAETLFGTGLPVLSANIPYYILTYVLVIISIGLLSGLYSSTYLSGLNITRVFCRTVNYGRSKSVFRFGLIVLQLVIFIVLVSGAFIVNAQYRYALSKDPGYRTDDLLIVDMGRDLKQYEVVMDAFRSLPDVLSAGGSMFALPSTGGGSTMIDHATESDRQEEVYGIVIDYDFIETMGLQVVKGRGLSREMNDDESVCVVNETAVRKLGIEQPIGYDMGGLRVVGVIKDFDAFSVHHDIPLFQMNMAPGYYFKCTIHYQTGSLKHLLPQLKAKWEELVTDRTFSYQTYDDYRASKYEDEKNLSHIVTIAAIFALLIAALGLVGLVYFIIETQTKAIGIRKVHGSSVWDILKSFMLRGLVMLGVAMLVAVPLVLYIMKQWLDNFAFKINISPVVFIMAFVLAAVVMSVTVLLHTFRVMRLNPVESLRYE